MKNKYNSLASSEKIIRLEKQKKNKIIFHLNRAAVLLGKEDYKSYDFARRTIRFLVEDILA